MLLKKFYEGACLLRSLKRPCYFNRCPETLLMVLTANSASFFLRVGVQEKETLISLWLPCSFKEAVICTAQGKQPRWVMLSTSNWWHEGQKVATSLLPAATANDSTVDFPETVSGGQAHAFTAARLPHESQLPPQVELVEFLWTGRDPPATEQETPFLGMNSLMMIKLYHDLTCRYYQWFHQQSWMIWV